jgi:hypothetical protein
MAGSPSRTLKLTYLADASKFTKQNKDAESSLSKLGDKFKTFGKFAAAGVAVAGVALAAFAKSSIDAAREAEAAQSRLATILRTTVDASDDQIRALKEQADALQGVGVASSGNITALQAQLATFDLSVDTIQTLTPAITDYVIAEKGATATTGDFQSAANGLAQALQGNFASLTKTGFVLDDTTKDLIANGTESERAAALVEVLNSTYEGFNETARETSEGQLVALQNSFGDLKESIGTALLPIMNDLVGVANDMIDRFKEFWSVHGPAIIEKFDEVKETALLLWAQLKEKLGPIFSDIKDAVVELWTNAQELLTRFREWWLRVGPGVIASFKTLKEPIIAIWENLKEAWTNVKELFATFKRGEGDGQNFQRFINVLVVALRAVAFVINLIITAVNKMLAAFRRVTESKAFQALLSGIGAIGRGIGNLAGKVTGLADGGIVTRPTLAMVGEGGEPEAVIPLSKMGQIGGGGVNITINGALDPEGVARQIRRILDDSTRRTGATLAVA